MQRLRRITEKTLERVRGGDRADVEKLQQLLRKLETVDDDTARSVISLADIRGTIERKHQQGSLEVLLRFAHPVDSLHIPAVRFLWAVREGWIELAKTELEAHPRSRELQYLHCRRTGKRISSRRFPGSRIVERISQQKY